MKKNTLVKVNWVDTITQRGWQDRNSIEDELASRCTSVGYVVADNKKVITIAGTVGSNDSHTLDAITIPKGCITKIRRIKND